MSDPRTLLAELAAVRAEALTRLAACSQAQLDWRPPAAPENSAAWPLGEQFMHQAIDEHDLRELIARPLPEGTPPAGLPKAVTAFWFERAWLLTRRLVGAWPAAPILTLRHDGGLVQVFGGLPMNGAEWLASGAGHEAFHHRQIDAVLALPRQQEVA